MSIEDDLDIARKKKLQEQEDNLTPKISMMLQPPGSEDVFDEDYIEEKNEKMGVYDEEPSNNQQIIEAGSKISDYGKGNEDGKEITNNEEVVDDSKKENLPKEGDSSKSQEQSPPETKIESNKKEEIPPKNASSEASIAPTSQENPESSVSLKSVTKTELQNNASISKNQPTEDSKNPKDTPIPSKPSLSTVSKPLNTSISSPNITSEQTNTQNPSETLSSPKPTTNRTVKKPTGEGQTLSSSSSSSQNAPLRDLHQAGDESNVSDDPKIMKITQITSDIKKEDQMKLNLNSTEPIVIESPQNLTLTKTKSEENTSEEVNVVASKEINSESIRNTEPKTEIKQSNTTVHEPYKGMHVENEDEPHVIALDIPTIQNTRVVNPAKVISNDSKLLKKIVAKKNEAETKQSLIETQTDDDEDNDEEDEEDLPKNKPNTQKQRSSKAAPYAPAFKKDSEEEEEGTSGEEAHQEKQVKDEAESARQMGLVIYTFSDKVTPGLLQYSVITFYVSVVFVASRVVRGYLWGNTSKIYLSALPYPDELLII